MAENTQTFGQSTATSITIYNRNFALVKDIRRVLFVEGRNTITIADVAARLDPTSVHFKSLTAPNTVVVREQNYRYDLIDPPTLLNKSVGKPLTIRQFLGDGTMLSADGILLNPLSVQIAQTGEHTSYANSHQTLQNGLVIQQSDGHLLLNPMGEITLHEMPPGLTPTPELVWLIDCDQPGEHETEVSYMTEGVTWKADYVAIVNADDTLIDMTGWVTLDNKSGATYENAGLQLVAGNVRRITPPNREMMPMAGSYKAATMVAQPQFEEETLFEYHLYTLSGVTTVRNNEQKQMTLLNANEAPTLKKYIYDGRRGFWGIGVTSYQPGEGYDNSSYTKVNVVMEIRNSLPALGIPLPKGKIRMYKADSRGGVQFIGEEEIDHTPKDETLRLYIGDSFDVVGEHKRTGFRRLSKREVEETFEITLRNHRDTAAQISVIEHLWSDWKIIANSTDYNKKDAHTADFPVMVPADGESRVTYTVRTRWF